MSTPTNNPQSAPAVAGIVKAPAPQPENQSVRYFRLRTASRAMTWTGIVIWVIYLFMASMDQTTPFLISLVALMPFIGLVLTLGGIIFGAAASFVYDEPAKAAARS